MCVCVRARARVCACVYMIQVLVFTSDGTFIESFCADDPDVFAGPVDVYV